MVCPAYEGACVRITTKPTSGSPTLARAAGVGSPTAMEKEYMGSGRAKMWTYLILALVLVLGTVVANFALTSPETAREGVDAFVGLPPYAFPSIAIGVGSLIFLVGLRLETDWPEGIGALLVSGGVAGGEILLGWENFELGGLVVVPYVIPVAIFLVMMGYSIARSR